MIAKSWFCRFLILSFATFLFASYFLAFSLPVQAAATYYWVGGATNSNTSNPANWATSAGACANSANLNVPGPTDTVRFVSNCQNSATVDSAMSVANFWMNAGYTGTVTISGVSLAVTAGLSVDGGVFYVSNGGTVTAPPGSGGFVIGDAATGYGTVTVTGSGSQLTQTISGNTRLRLGNNTGAVGNLNILNGATVNTGNIYAAYSSGSTANITVDGVNTVWNTDTSVNLGFIGRSGTATLTVSNGAIVNAAAKPWQIGGLAGSIGVVTVSGTGSQLNFTTVGSTPRVGYSGTGTLNVNDGGVVMVNNGAGSIIVAALAGSTGRLNIGAGYTINSITASSIGPGLGSAYLPPSQPTGLIKSSVSPTEITWDWDDLVGATGYKVYRAADNTLLTTISSVTSNWTQDLLDSNTLYSVYVRGG